eukprot:CRZ06957.1 hypothetical protein [Spongospora subterranea]
MSVELTSLNHFVYFPKVSDPKIFELSLEDKSGKQGMEGFSRIRSAGEDPKIAAYTSMASSTVAVMGPIIVTVPASHSDPVRSVRPNVVFKPTTPQREAGIRTEPGLQMNES